MEAYNVAMKEDYRFGTYGDAMLIIWKFLKENKIFKPREH
jgi:S-adenosylmethionine:tRNA-ribosyltransferase-isomerase (queuine synthetase)